MTLALEARRLIGRHDRVLALELAAPCVPPRVRGRVGHVSPSGALITITVTAGARHGRVLEVPAAFVTRWGCADLYQRPGSWHPSSPAHPTVQEAA